MSPKGIGAKSFAYLHSLGKLPKSLDKLKFAPTKIFNAHQLSEYINRKELDTTLAKILMITDAVQKDFPQFEYLSFIDDYIPKELPAEYVAI